MKLDSSSRLRNILTRRNKTTVCGHPGCACAGLAAMITLPNIITITRTVVSAIVAIAGLMIGNGWIILLAYVLYWIGDMLDGASARYFRQETVLGAKLDIICDRINATLCLLGVAMVIPNYLAEGIFFLQFMVVDLILSLIIFRWPLLSPNYFYAIDKLIYYLNWHTIAKALNTSLFIILLIAFENPTYAIIASSLLLALKLFSLIRVKFLYQKLGNFRHLANYA